jgi:hypothetical protein
MGSEHCSRQAGPGRQHLSEDRTVELYGDKSNFWHARRDWVDTIKHCPDWLG